MTTAGAMLDLPTLDAFDSYIEALQEGYYMGIQPKADAALIAMAKSGPKAHLESLNEQKTGRFTTPDGNEFEFVPHELLWLMKGPEFIGSLSFRLYLSEYLTNFGGHIGYGIRPKYQGQGFGKLILALAKKRAVQHGIDRLRLTCSPDNPASEKVILQNGGIHEDTVENIYGTGRTAKRFWIDVHKEKFA